MDTTHTELSSNAHARAGSRHADYPHSAGALYDCAACEAQCHCTPDSAECVFDGPHDPQPSYVREIGYWSDIRPAELATIEREANAAHARTPGMHDTRVDLMVHAALNGISDATGSDAFGYSVAWLDLSDHTIDESELAYFHDVPTGVDYWNLGAYLATWRDVGGCRYALAYLDADGSRSAVGYATREDMMTAYREHESAYLAWEESADSLT
jgi:hypothetical protein